jgi:glycosyltransferase involved in cell wall biosynthesis
MGEKARAYVFKKRYERRETLLRRVRTLCVSRHLFNLAVAFGVGTPDHLQVIPLGVNTAQFRPLAVSKLYDLLFVGRYRWVKGLDILLGALSLLGSDGGVPRVGIVGHFSAQERLHLLSLVPDRIRTQVRFLGTIPNEEMPEAIRSSRFVVIPSRYETFSMVALEAVACGVPVVAFNVGALPELVTPDVGILVEPCAPDALASALRMALSDANLPVSAMERGPRKARRYDWETVASEVQAALA